MPAYTGVWSVVSEHPVPAELTALARKLVGGMLQTGGIVQRQWNLPDGGSIHAQIVNGTPKVTIIQGGTPTEPPSEIATLWAPRGFLVTPASFAAPRGAGLPVEQKGTDPYAKANLDPGLDFSRWAPGGFHGQVLLTTDPDAGYPPLRAQMAPMYYGTLGPAAALNSAYDQRPTGKEWLAFRPSYVDFAVHYPTESKAGRRALFSDVNAYRDSHGVTKGYLMPRGFYRPAEVLSYLMTANGKAQKAFPKGYKTETERLQKDGPWSLTAAAELFTTGGTAAGAVATWQAAHSADLLLDVPSAPTFVDVGFSAGNWTLVTEPRDQWVAAGRRTFQSSDTALPPISWDGPPALNLGWTTFPITHHDRSIWAPPPLVKPDGTFWLKYYNSTHGYRPAIGPNVYCRGRVLGVAPTDGFVLGAGIITMAHDDRLMILAYHPSENAALDMATQGMMAVVHVWYADLPNSGGALRLHATQPVTTWQDGGTITLPGIKYESFWEFAPDGSKAVCLRDAVSISEILDYFSSAYVGGNAYGWYSGAFKGVLCEIMVSLQPNFTLRTTALTTKSFLARGMADQFNFRPSLYPSNPPEAPADAWAAEDQLVPLAAGYVNGAPRVAYHGFSSLLENATDPRVTPPALGGDGKYWYAAFGGPALVYPSQSDSAVVMAKGVLSASDAYAYPAAPVPLIADIAQQVVIADLDTTAAKLVSYSLSGGLYTYTYAANPAFATNILNTSGAVRRVRVFQRAQFVHERAFAHPYGVVWATDRIFLPVLNGDGSFAASTLDPAHPFNPDTDSWAIFPAAPDLTLQPVFARRGEERIVGYQIGLATPLTTLAFGALANPTMTDYAAAYRINLTQTILPENRPVLGGWYTTTFIAPDTGGAWLAEATTC